MRYHPTRIEKKWQRIWQRERAYEPDLKRAKKPFYNLMMFPYPSAEGLHIGAARTFTGVDIYGRFKRMQGYDVFEPMGLDGFGIHSENYALKIGKHPVQHAKDSEKNFYRQLGMIGDGFAWEEKLETYDPDYYKWTQWIFVQLFKRGLAYRKRQPVNWCPSCKTVLADEQVIAGECERCQSRVEKKELEQWFFKITDYAERLLKNLEKLDWSERVKIAQKNWIGRSEGALIRFNVKCQMLNVKCPPIEVFTTRPDTLFGATYVVLSPEHPLIQKLEPRITNYNEIKKYIEQAKKKPEQERIAEGLEKTGVELKGIKAINPANGKEIPIWVADYVLGHVGAGAIMAVPAHDQRDYEFAKKFCLPSRKVIAPKPVLRIVRSAHDVAMGVSPELRPESDCWEGEGELINSNQFNEMSSERVRWEITKFVGGKRQVQYRLRDWLISRQRYWGPPIPMIYCEVCAAKGRGEQKEMPGWYAVPEKDLPVPLPYVKNFKPLGMGTGPLASVRSFYKTKCPKCKSPARRETDVSDSFLDSSWYFLRYPSVREKRHPWNPAVTKKWLPVNMYIGGAEHSVLHLLYSRFVTMALHDFGLLYFEEPFTRFRAHGLITKDGAKMSKSRGNVVNPDEYIKAFGADAIRMYLAFMAPLEQGGDFRDAGIKGVTRFLERAWRFANEKAGKPKVLQRESSAKGATATVKLKIKNDDLQRHIHRVVKKVTEDIEMLHYNTAISTLMVLLNKFEENADAVAPDDIKTFLKLLAPFAPHITEELWQQIKPKTKNQKPKTLSSIHIEPWPQYDSTLLQEDTVTVVFQVNGRVRDQITTARNMSESELKAKALTSPKVQKWLGGKKPKRVIVVPQRVVNVVV